MYCRKCGEKLPENAKFCFACGDPVGQRASTKDNSSSIKTYVMKCKSCSSTMNIDPDKKILICPYCGSKEIIIENDSVTIEKIKSDKEKFVAMQEVNAKKAIALAKIEMEKAKLLENESTIQQLFDELADIDREKKNFLQTISLSQGHEFEESKISRKINLIKAFIVPNTLPSVCEFIYVAISQIDIKLSKSTFGHRWKNKDIQIENTLQGYSDAWVEKMIMVYQRAERKFIGVPEFMDATDAYIKEMEKLKIKL